MTTLHPFGAVHADRRGKVRAELAALVAETDAEALFVEFPAGGWDLRTTRDAFLRAPLFALGLALAAVLQWPLYALLCRSPQPAEVLAARSVGADLDVPVHAVDDHPIQSAARSGPPVVVGNWVALAATLAVAPTAVATLFGVVFAVWLGGSLLRRLHPVAWGVVALGGLPAVGGVYLTLGVGGAVGLVTAVAALVVGLRRTFDHRNRAMVDRIAERSAADGYDAVVLTTGKAHLSGVRAVVEGRDDVRLGGGHRSRFLRTGRPWPDGDPAADDADRSNVDVETARVEVIGRRAVATAVDAVVALGIGGAVALSLGVAAGVGALFAGVGDPGQAIAGGLLAGGPLAWLAYHVGCERAFGRTLGKRLLGVRVVAADGGRPSWRATLVRTLFRPVEVLPVGLPAVVAATADDRRRRIGDRVAGTLVVADEPRE